MSAAALAEVYSYLQQKTVPDTMFSVSPAASALSFDLDIFNAKCRAFDTPEEQELRARGIELNNQAIDGRIAKDLSMLAKQAEVITRLRELDTDDVPEPARGAVQEAIKQVSANTKPLSQCPIAGTNPNVSGFELSKAVWDILPELLPHNERNVLRALADHYGLPKGIYPSNETIQALTGLSESSVLRALNRLEAAKYIAVAISSDRRGDPTGKKRAGGRSVTTHWVLNVGGIWHLAYGEKAIPQTGFNENPFSQTDKAVPQTQNPFSRTENPVPGMDEQNESRPENKPSNQPTPEGGKDTSPKPAAKANPEGERDLAAKKEAEEFFVKCSVEMGSCDAKNRRQIEQVAAEKGPLAWKALTEAQGHFVNRSKGLTGLRDIWGTFVREELPRLDSILQDDDFRSHHDPVYQAAVDLCIENQRWQHCKSYNRIGKDKRYKVPADLAALWRKEKFESMEEARAAFARLHEVQKEYNEWVKTNPGPNDEWF